MNITHYKGVHASLPFKIKCSNNQTIEWLVNFTDAAYDLQGVDQYDWNKLCGIKWNYFQPTLNTIMVGWRYINSNYELCMYVHDNGSFNPPSEPLFVTDKLANCKLELNKSNKKVKLSIWSNAENLKSIEIDWNLFGNYWFINSWFGGNMTPNRTLKFNLDQI